ncbi:MAG: phage head spike fiber domain-containing protein, partial [Acidobacteriaceae bacterium]
MWLRVPSGSLATSIYIINVGDQGWSIAGSTPVALTTSWQQFQVSGTNQNGLSTLLLQIAGAGTFTNGAVIEVWGGELKASSAPDTNILPSSQQVAGMSWGINAGVVTGNSVLAPDNSNTGATVTANSGSTDTYFVDSVQNPSQFSSATVTASVYLRVPSGTQTINLYIINVGSNGWSVPNWEQATLTTTWQRFQITGTNQSALSDLLLQIGGAGSFTSGQNICVWGAQMVAGSAAGNYEGTGGSTTNPVTGAAELLAANGLNQSYSYDSFGNIAQSGAFVFQPSYTSANRVSGFSYDASGN